MSFWTGFNYYFIKTTKMENGNENDNNISYEQMSKYVRKREHLWQAMERDGWMLPSKHAAICTTGWMLQVRNAEVFCLHRKEEFKERKCFTPPPRQVLH